MNGSKWQSKKVAVLGWGDDTQDVVPWLKNQGASITIFDENPKVLKEIKGVGELKEKFENLKDFDLIIRNPAVYRYRDEIVEAEKAGVEISSKTKLFFDLCTAKVIGVTGTKGKGTTATLIFEILKAAGKKVYLGGNIGTGVMGELGNMGKDDWVVLELSSFQLIDLQKSPHIAVVLMTTSEHLDWHKNSQEYVDAKKNIVSHQQKGDFAVVNKDYPNSKGIGQAAEGKVIWISGKDVSDFETRLRGEHNKENIAAALAVSEIVGVDPKTAKEVVKNFQGLEHRLEEVATVNGVTYYNDSFSTVPETAVAAIKAFTGPEIVILGGSSKNSDFTELGEIIREAKNIKAVILIGTEAGRIEKAIGPHFTRLQRVPRGKGMEEIVNLAYNIATSGDIVLLSPACASFDMFSNYKDRGDQFKEQVRTLAKNEAKNH